MEITVKKIDDINFIINGSIDNDMIKEKVEKLQSEAKIDAADDEKTEESIEQEAAGEAFREFVDAGIKEANINVDTLLGQPGLKKYEQKNNRIYFEVEIAISPEINTDVDYSDIVPDFTMPTADPVEVENKLSELVQKQAPLVKIELPRAVENNDVVVIDFKGYIGDEAFEGGSAENFNLKIGSNSFIPGFEEQLIGMEYGEERSILVTFPKDYQAPNLAGKETKFVVKLHEIQEQKAKTPDDEYAQKILNDPKATLTTLKQKLAEQIISDEVSKIYMDELKPKIVEGFLSKFYFTLPNNVVEQEIDAKVSQKSRTFTQEQHKEYKENQGKFMEFRESVRPEARDSIKIGLIVDALAKKEGIEVHEQEVHAALGYQAMITGQDAQELVKHYEDNNLMTSVKLGLTEDKLFGMMLGFYKA